MQLIIDQKISFDANVGQSTLFQEFSNISIAISLISIQMLSVGNFNF